MFESERHALAYLMGVYLSDGSLSRQWGYFSLQVKDKEFRDEVAQAMKRLDARLYLGTDSRGYYRLKEKSPYHVGWWLETWFPSGKDRLPSIPSDLARDLVAGILDGDGTIWLTKRGYYELQVCGYCNYLADLQSLLAAHDVVMHYRPGWNNHYINIKSFVTAGFYFRLLRKQALVEEYKRRYLT